MHDDNYFSTNQKALLACCRGPMEPPSETPVTHRGETAFKIGFLLKRGSLIQSWKRRLFVLKRDRLECAPSHCLVPLRRAVISSSLIRLRNMPQQQPRTKQTARQKPFSPSPLTPYFPAAATTLGPRTRRRAAR